MARSRTALHPRAGWGNLILRRAERERPRVAWRPGSSEILRRSVLRPHALGLRSAGTLAAQSILLKVSAAEGGGRVRPRPRAHGEGLGDPRPAGAARDHGA